MAKFKQPKLEIVRGDDDMTFNIDYNRETHRVITGINEFKYEYCEFVFQFDDDEPVVFAKNNPTSYKQNLTINVNNTANGTIAFKHNGRTFKIYARDAKKNSIA